MSTAAPIRKLATSGIAWGAAVSAAIAIWVLFGLGGNDYYRSSLRTRGYAAGHQLLRPSGPVGQTLGVAGTVLMIVPFIYMARKRFKGLASTGTVRTWLEIHLFCGIVGPVFVTLHTSFKFNGIISTAYWSMVAVMLSGFVGRYLYVRIPRSIRGVELTRAEVDEQAGALAAALAASGAGDAVLKHMSAVERQTSPHSTGTLSIRDLLLGEIRLSRALRDLDREMQASGLAADVRASALRLAAERTVLLHRAAYLQRTKKLFELWHVFHLPLVYLLLIIAAAHIGVALYMGYVPFRW